MLDVPMEAKAHGTDLRVPISAPGSSAIAISGPSVVSAVAALLPSGVLHHHDTSKMMS